MTTLVTLPRPQRYEAKTLTKEQAVKLLEVARSSRLEALLLVALTTGLRRGELVALRWNDVDLDQGVLFVRRTLTRIIGQGYVETEPKTRTRRRKIVLPVVAVEKLKAHRDRQSEERFKAGKNWYEQGIVFCNQFGGFYNPKKVDKHFQQLLKEAGLEYMRFHDLRHSTATILLTAGVHPKVVQERMGHSTIAMTMDIYSHVLPSMQQEAADKIDDMFRQ